MEAEQAVVELERRARIEARRDAWLAADENRHVCHRHGGIGLWTMHEGRRKLLGLGEGPNSHAQLEAALNAAGAP